VEFLPRLPVRKVAKKTDPGRFGGKGGLNLIK